MAQSVSTRMERFNLVWPEAPMPAENIEAARQLPGLPAYQAAMVKTIILHMDFHLGSLQDALAFNNYHEGLHLGYMKSIAKFV